MGAFTVNVGGKDYDVDAPDEKTAWKWAKATHIKSLGKEGVSQPAPTPFRSSAEKAVTPQEEVLGNPMVRGMIGAARPFVGAGQLIANTVGMGEPVNKAITETDRNIQRGREFIGSTGFDAFQAGGQMASPAYLGAAAAMPNAASTAGRIWQGTKFGAGAGAAEPVTGPNYWSEKGAQTVGGAATGAVIPAAWEGTKALGRAVRNVAQPYMGEWGANQATGRLAKNVAGDKSDDIIDLMQRSTPTLPGSAPTAGQAAVPAGSAEFSALQKIAATRDPSKFYGIESGQKKSLIDALRTIGKSDDELTSAVNTRAENAAEAYSPELMGTRVSPQSQTQVMDDAIKGRYQSRAAALQDQGRFNTTAAQMETAGNQFVPVPGMPRVSSRASNFPDRVKEAGQAAADTQPVIRTRMAEEKFLTDMQENLRNTVGLENRSLYDFLGRPSVKRALKEAADAAAEKGVYFPNKPGDEFSIGNLQRIKQAISDEINKNQAVQGLGATQKKEITDTVGAFTKWLENKSPEWKKARIGYMEDSLPINQMQVGQFLEKKLVPALSDDVSLRPTSYANALREADQLVKRSTGQDRPIESFMRPDQMTTLRNVGGELSRDATMNQLAKRGQSEALRRIGAQVPEVGPTGFFDPKISFMRGAVNRVSGQATDRILNQLGKKMDNPQEMARIMREAKPFERKAIVDALMRYQGVAPQVMDEGR